MTFNMALSVFVRSSICLALTLSDTICIWMCQWKVWGGLSWKSITSELNTSHWHQIHPATVGQHPPSTIRRLHFRSKPGSANSILQAVQADYDWGFPWFVQTRISQSCGKQGAILCHCSFSFRAWGAITWPIKPHLVQIAILKSDSSTACTTQIIALLAKNTTRVHYQTTGPQASATS